MFVPTCGSDFEDLCARLFEGLGFAVQKTAGSGDQGADLIMSHPRIRHRIAVQCKFYSHTLDNTPVQEVVASLRMYGCGEGWVVTNGSFSKGAVELARANYVKLIDGQRFNELLSQKETYEDTSFILDDLLAGSGLIDDESSNGERQQTSQPYAQSSNQRPVQPDASSAVQLHSPQGEREESWQSYQQPSSWQRTQPYPVVRQVRPTFAVDGRAAGIPEDGQRERTYDLEDVALRWGVSAYRVKQEIQYGLPLYKQENGRYSIAEPDLLAYENARRQRMAEAQRRQLENGRRSRLIAALRQALLFAVALLVILVFIYAYWDTLYPIIVDSDVAQWVESFNSWVS